MYSYVLRRLAFGALTVVGVSVVVFLIMRVMPGDPLTAIFGPEGMTRLSEEQRASYMRELGLADPLWVQYLRWLGDIARGDLGRSFFRAESVGEMVMRRGPLTAQIAILSVILSWLIGVPVALVSALRPNSLSDTVARVLSIACLAVPGFWLGMLIVLALVLGFGYRAPLTASGALASQLIDYLITMDNLATAERVFTQFDSQSVKAETTQPYLVYAAALLDRNHPQKARRVLDMMPSSGASENTLETARLRKRLDEF